MQLRAALEGAFLCFRRRVYVAFRYSDAAMTRNLLDLEGVRASFTEPCQKRVAQRVYNAILRKLQILSQPGDVLVNVTQAVWLASQTNSLRYKISNLRIPDK